MNTTEEQFSYALMRVSKSLDRQTELIERLLDIIPASREAEMLGVSAQTVRAKRKARKIERLLP